MTLHESEPSIPAQRDDRHSNMDAPRSGPNKDGASAPDGPSALGNEVGGYGDAKRERAAALADGEQLPNSSYAGGENEQGLASGVQGDANPFGQLQGKDKGYGDGPSSADRTSNQHSKDAEWQSGGAVDPKAIARGSAGTANHNPVQDQDAIVSTGNQDPAAVLDTAARSGGTESGMGAYDGGVLNQAGTDNVPE